MNSYYLNYYFNMEVFKYLEDKYLSKINIDKNKIFLYSNSFEITRFFSLYHPFFNYKKVIDLFTNNPKDLFIYLINYIRQNSYNKDDITLLYSLANYYILSTSEDNNNISYSSDLYFLKENTNCKKYKKYFKEINQYSSYILNTFRDCISDTYHIYNFDIILNLSLNYFLKFTNNNLLLKLKYRLYKPFSKNYKTIILNKPKDINELNFSKDLIRATNFIEIINEALYLSKFEKINSYFKL